MASVSFSLTGQQDAKVTNVVTGTSAPSAGDVSVEVNLANIPNRKEAIKLIRAIIRYIENGSINTVFRP
jgi:hypothetical protein